MKTKQTAVAVAVQTVTGSGIRPADRANVATPGDATGKATITSAQAKAIKQGVADLKAVEALALDSEQCAALVDMGCYALEEQGRRESWLTEFRSMVRRVFVSPEQFAWGFYKPLAKWYRAEFGTFAYQQLRKALEELAGEYGCEMPTAGTGTGGGKKHNAKRTMRAIRTTCDALVKQVAELRLCDVNEKVLAQWAPVMKALREAQGATSKAVNE